MKVLNCALRCVHYSVLGGAGGRADVARPTCRSTLSARAPAATMAWRGRPRFRARAPLASAPDGALSGGDAMRPLLRVTLSYARSVWRNVHDPEFQVVAIIFGV